MEKIFSETQTMKTFLVNCSPSNSLLKIKKGEMEDPK